MNTSARVILSVHMVKQTSSGLQSGKKNCENDYWNKGKDTPIPQENIRIVVQVDSPVKGVYAASPDREAMQAQAIQYTDFESDKGAFIEFVLPRIGYWTVVWIDLQGENI